MQNVYNFRGQDAIQTLNLGMSCFFLSFLHLYAILHIRARYSAFGCSLEEAEVWSGGLRQHQSRQCLQGSTVSKCSVGICPHKCMYVLFQGRTAPAARRVNYVSPILQPAVSYPSHLWHPEIPRNACMRFGSLPRFWLDGHSVDRLIFVWAVLVWRYMTSCLSVF